MHVTWLWYHISSHKNSCATCCWTDPHGSAPELVRVQIFHRAFIRQHQMKQVFLISWDGLALFVNEHFHEQSNPVHNQMATERGQTSKEVSMVYIRVLRCCLQSVLHKTASIRQHHLANSISGFSWAAIWQSNTV